MFAHNLNVNLSEIYAVFEDVQGARRLILGLMQTAL